MKRTLLTIIIAFSLGGTLLQAQSNVPQWWKASAKKWYTASDSTDAANYRGPLPIKLTQADIDSLQIIPAGAATSALQDSIKNRVIATMTYFNTMISYLSSSATTTTQAAIQASVDSVKNRIIETMSYYNTMISYLSSGATTTTQAAIQTSVDSAANRLSLVLNELNTQTTFLSTGATTTLQGTQITRLDSLLARASLILNQLNNTLTVSGTVTANAGTNLNTSALALETGGNLASIKTNTDKIPTSPSTQAGQDSTKNRVIELMAYLNSLISTHATSVKQDTQITRADSALARLLLILNQLNNTLSVSGTVSLSGTSAVSIVGGVDINGTVPVSGTFWQATQPVSGTVSLSGTSAVSVQGTVLVDGSGVTQPVSGTVALSGTSAVSIVGGVDINGTVPVSIASMPSTPVTGTFWQATQPISAASLPLPSGASTSAGQDSTKNRIIELMAYYNTMITNQGTNSSKIDSVKNRIVELMAYQNSIKSKLDSLFSYTYADSLNTALTDSVNNTYDSLIVNYTKWVKYSFSGDSTFVIDFDRNFPNPKTFAPGTGYTFLTGIAGHNKIYMKKKSTAAGYMRRNLAAEGK